jgi:hypothetical protein
MEQVLLTTLNELNFPDMKYQTGEQGPDCFYIRLWQEPDVEIRIEILYEDGGIVGSVLSHHGMTHTTKSLIMNTLMKHLEVD